MKRAACSAVVLAPLLCAVACSVPVSASGPLAIYPRPDYGMDALLEGQLRLADGCIAIEQADGVLIAPIFPDGDATWIDAVLTWRGEEYRAGDRITLGGGLAGAQGAYIPEGCAKYDTFLVSPY